MNTALWTEFVNSDRHDHLGTGRREDSLDDPAWLDRFLKRWGLEFPRVSRERLVGALRKFRCFLQHEAENIASGRPVKPENLHGLNAYLDSSPLVRRLDLGQSRAEVRLEPVRRTVSSILGEIAFSFADTIANGDASRIKVCGNKDCRWIIYDNSKSKTRKWCESTCGNLMKVRRFRQKRR